MRKIGIERNVKKKLYSGAVRVTKARSCRGVAAHFFLILGARWTLEVKFTPRPLCPLYPLNR